MINVNFEITERDIQEYLKKHKEDESIKYREAMFVKYMKEQEGITCEALEILAKKYNWEDRVISGTYQYDYLGVLKQESLPNFNSYLNGIQNLDISGICHILIPTLGYYYDEYREDYQLIGVPYIGLNALSMKLIGTIPENINEQLTTAIEDYYTVGKIDKFHYHNRSAFINIRMGRDHCRKELQEYSSIYGEEPIKIIRKKIRERV